jgi:hypothetical protein
VVSRSSLDHVYARDPIASNVLDVLVARAAGLGRSCSRRCAAAAAGWPSRGMARLLARRLVLLSCLWIALGLAAAAWRSPRVPALGRGILRRPLERCCTPSSRAETDASGVVRVARTLPDPRFGQTLAGWYWQVSNAGGAASASPRSSTPLAPLASRRARWVAGPRVSAFACCRAG